MTRVSVRVFLIGLAVGSLFTLGYWTGRVGELRQVPRAACVPVEPLTGHAWGTDIDGEYLEARE